MKSSMYKGLSKEDKEAMKDLFEKSRLLRLRYKDVLEDKLRTSRDKSEGKDSYDSPNWALVQADQIGYNRAISELINLF